MRGLPCKIKVLLEFSSRTFIESNLLKLNVQIFYIQRILFDKSSARFDLVAH